MSEGARQWDEHKVFIMGMSCAGEGEGGRVSKSEVGFDSQDVSIVRYVDIN